MSRSRLILASMLILGMCVGAMAQGPLTPPGAPAPIYKTLDQIEPRKPISTSSLPLTISQPGSYYLTSHIAFATLNTNAITISCPNVTIDLMGFAMVGPGKTSGTSGDAIHLTPGAAGERNNISITNGSISKWRGCGINLEAGELIRINDIRSENNGDDGLAVGKSAIVTNCSATQNGGSGIKTGQLAVLSECTSSFNGLHGYSLDTFSKASDLTALSNTENGIESAGHSQIQGCMIGGSVVYGINLGYRSEVRDCVITGSYDAGIRIAHESTVLNNSVKITGIVLGAIGNGIEVLGPRNRIEGNSVQYAITGYLVNTGSVENLIIKNSATNCTTSFDIVEPSNAVGPIQSVSGTITSTNSYVNFVH